MRNTGKKLNNISRSGSQQANHQKPRPEKSERRLKHQMIALGVFFMVILGIVLELALEFIPGLFLSLLPLIYGAVIYLLKDVYEYIKKLCNDNSDYQELKTQSLTRWRYIYSWIKIIICLIRKSNEVFLGSILITGLLTSTAWAQFHVGARFCNAVEAFIVYTPETDSGYDNTDSPSTADNDKTDTSESAPLSSASTEISAVDPTSSNHPDPIPPITDETDAASEYMPPDPLGVSKSTSQTDLHLTKEEQIEKARRMRLEEPTEDWSISESDRKKLFFIDGEYAIGLNWTAEQAAVKVKAFINDYIACQYPNVFDQLAGQTLRNDVANASTTDNNLATSTEKDSIIQTRLNAYDCYKKKALASLLAEDFHCYALAYQYYNGDQETIVSYYLQSTKWLYESLKFAENSPETQIEIMTSLKYRYNDIMTYSEPKSEEWLRAKLLSDAFDSLIDRGL